MPRKPRAKYQKTSLGEMISKHDKNNPTHNNHRETGRHKPHESGSTMTARNSAHKESVLPKGSELHTTTHVTSSTEARAQWEHKVIKLAVYFKPYERRHLMPD